MTDTMTLRLVSVEHGADAINLYRFAAPDRTPLPAFEPGAHIDVDVAPGVTRQYSLLWSPGTADRYEIAVHYPGGDTSSARHLHRESVVGAKYQVSQPRNHFGLTDEDGEFHLFAGGIGITPIVSMYRKLAADGRKAQLHYWTRSPARTLFHEELAGATGVEVIHTESPGVPRLAEVVADIPASAQLYCCGPTAMIDEFERITAGRDPECVHRERFTAKTVEETDLTGFDVTLQRAAKRLHIGPEETILGACIEAGLDVAFSCEEGVCGACEVSVIAGDVEHRDSVLTVAEQAKNDRMMICCSRGRGNVVIDI